MLTAALPLVALCATALAQQPTQVRDAGLGPEPGDAAGTAIAPAGDWNSDGVADFVVGIPGYDTNQLLGGPYADAGRIEIRSGADGSLLYGYTDLNLVDTTAGAPPAQLGASVAGPFDTNGNGVPEVAASAPGAERVVFVERGLFTAVKVAELAPLTGSTPTGYDLVTGPDANFGSTLVALGDVNGDGFSDLLLGTPDADFEFDDIFQGTVTVHDLGIVRIVDGATLNDLFVTGGIDEDERYGAAACATGDVSGDGRGDVAIGIPGARKVVILRPAPLPIGPPFLDTTIEADPNDPAYEGFGSSLALLGDVDGFGKPDLLIGSPDAQTLGQPAGRVSAIRLEGLADPFAQTVLWERSSTGLELGGAVAGADLDGDGFVEALSYERENDGIGRVVALNGANGALEATFPAPFAGEAFALVGLDPIENDGSDVVAIGQPDIEFGRGGWVRAQYLPDAPIDGFPAGTYTVDDDGPADFASVALAALAVDAGSELRVATGVYDRVVQTREGILRATPGFFETVEIVGLTVTAPATTVIGPLVLDGLELHGATARTTIVDATITSTSTVAIEQCADVGFSGCTILGATPLPNTGTPAAVTVDASTARFESCTIVGATGAPIVNTGGIGLDVHSGSRVWLAATSVRGGNGSPGSQIFAIPGGSGGDGIRAEPGSTVDLRGLAAHEVRGGAKGVVDLGGSSDGIGIRSLGGATVRVAQDMGLDPTAGVVAVTPARPWIEAEAAVPLGSFLDVRCYVPAGEVAVLVLAATPLALDDALVVDAPLFLDPLSFVTYQVFLGTGTAQPVQRSFFAPGTPTLQNATVEVQAFQYDAGAAAFRGTNGARVTLGS